MPLRLLELGDRECPHCELGEDCSVCNDTRELGEYSNRNFDLRAWMKPNEFSRWLKRKFPAECTMLASGPVIQL